MSIDYILSCHKRVISMSSSELYHAIISTRSFKSPNPDIECLTSLIEGSFRNKELRHLYMELRLGNESVYKQLHSITDPSARDLEESLNYETDNEFLSILKDQAIKHAECTRYEDGEIISKEYFEKLKSRILAKRVVLHCVEDDDIEAWNRISKYPFMERVYRDREAIYSWLNGKEPRPGSKMFDEFYNSIEKEPFEIAQSLIKSSLKSSDSALGAYNRSVAKPYGHFIIREILVKKGRVSSKGNINLIEQLVKDGADLFVGFNMALRTSFVYEPFLERKRNHKGEAAFMKKTISLLPGVNDKNKANVHKLIDQYSNLSEQLSERKSAEDVMTL